jgi:hypothetical protein
MAVLKFILTLLIWSMLTITSCSTTTGRSKQIDKTNLDTIYSVSTKQLMRNTIPDSVFKMISLRQLLVSGEDCDYRQFDDKGNDITKCWMITEIPPEIKNLHNLTTLRLTLNAIVLIPPEIGELKKLTLIDLTDNAGLTDIDNLAKIESLNYLYLYGCGLTKLPKNICDLRNLKMLGLVGNNFDKSEQNRITQALPNCIIKF